VTLIRNARVRAGSVERVPLAFMAILAIAMAGYFLIADSTLRAVLISAVSLLAPVAIVAGIVRHHPVAAAHWATLAVGLALNGVGTAIDWLSWIVADGVGVPSIADVFYLAGYAITFIALLLLVHRHTGDGARTASIDSAIVSTAVGIVIWVFVVQPVAHASALDPVSFAVTAAYPILDVAMLGLAVTILLQPARHGAAVYLVLAAVLVTYPSDVAWTYLSSTGEYVEASLVDAGWWLGPIFWGAAGLHSSMADFGAGHAFPASPVTRWRLLALGVAATVAPGVLILRGSELLAADVVMIEVAAIFLGWMVVFRLGHTLAALAQSLAHRTELQGELSHRAAHDPLTGLPNRLAFGERLELRLAAGGTGGTGGAAVLLLDLDDFKAVNDSHGHQVGDELLVQVAGRLRATLRDQDVAARLGGDEFAIILMDCATERIARDVGARLLDSFEEPFVLEGHMVFAHVTIGIAMTTAASRDADEVLRDADIAMYLAKGQGKGRLELYQPTMHASILQRISLRADLEEAITAKQFILQYQPIIGIEDGSLHGVEALVRWQHPVRGVIPPGEFIGLAEETGLIVPLGQWVLDEACRQLAEWRSHYPGARSLSMSVNVSGVQLQHPAFVDQLRRAVTDNRIPAGSLVLEMTESVLNDTDSSVRVLETLKAIGVRIAIDDFGTGYSSLSYVGRFPIDILKIDRSFVAALGGTSKEAALTSTIVDLAENLDLQTVAEGIEDSVQLGALRAMGCRMGQGFFFARPLHPGLVGALIDQQHQRSVAAVVAAPHVAPGVGPVAASPVAAHSGRSRGARS
jgi:diguanylate cyclase (GGDEF)-like protein